MTEISLNASMRSNLLSLQQTQKLQDRTQLRLSTGLKVNSAIDNPSSYYTATSLNNRASDLSALLDTMSQGIQTIKAANEALETGTAILQQAKAVAEKVSESSVDVVAKVHNETELLAAVEKGGAGYIIVESDIYLSKNTSVHLKDGQSLVGASYFDNNLPKTKISFDLDENSDNHGLYLANNSVLAELEIGGTRTTSSENSYDRAFVTAVRVKNVTIENVDVNAVNINETKSMAGIVLNHSTVEIKGDLNVNISGNGLFHGIYVKHEAEVNTEDNAKININVNGNGRSVWGISLGFNAVFNINNSEVNIQSISNSVAYAFLNSASELNIYNSEINMISSGDGFNGRGNIITNIYHSEINIQSQNYAFYNASANTFIDSSSKLFLNTDKISYNTDGNLTVGSGADVAIKSGGNSVFYKMSDFKADTNQSITKDNFESKTGAEVSDDSWDEPDWDKVENEITNPSQSHQVNVPEMTPITGGTSYIETISQYDMLINDASYKGINLLQSNNLKINFNEERTSGIEVKGVDVSAKGLGLHNLEWEAQMDVLNSIEELENAINQLRSISAEFGNYYSIVTTREDFTENLINVLTEGADKLTLADMNAESANMLALQTRQQLAINSLSLAPQASQSVLRLF